MGKICAATAPSLIRRSYFPYGIKREVVDNIIEYDAVITWNLTVNKLNKEGDTTSGLKDESFKYELKNKTTGVSYGSGNFADITDENKYTEERKNLFDDLQVKVTNWHKEQEHIAESVSVGMCIGVAIGALFFDNITTGMCIGILFGYIMGKYGDKEIDFKFGKKK